MGQCNVSLWSWLTFIQILHLTMFWTNHSMVNYVPARRWGGGDFTLIPNTKGKLKKNARKKSYSQKTGFLLVFRITFYWCTFSLFHLQIWNKHKILRFLVPILNYLKKTVFSSIFFFLYWAVYTPKLWFCPSGGDAVQTCAEMLGRRGAQIFF